LIERASQRLIPRVTQALRNNPDINHITTPFDTVDVFRGWVATE
jgi:hypothetical protein